jgi:hypothetical protein
MWSSDLAQKQYFMRAVRCKFAGQEGRMTNATESLILDLLEWVGAEDRGYAETMEAWRTSCPRLPVWEDANDRGLVTREFDRGTALVRLTESGKVHLSAARGLRPVAKVKKA